MWEGEGDDEKEGEDEGEGEEKEKEEKLLQVCSFCRKYSHQGPQDGGEAELSERYNHS